MYLLEYNCVDPGDPGKDLNHRLVQHRLHLGLEDLLHHKRHGDELVRPDFLEGFHQCAWCRGLSQPVDRRAVAERVDELGHEAVHVGHREHGDHPVLVRGRTMNLAELDRGAEIPVGQHHALRVAGRAGRVVDDRQIVHVVSRVDDILRAEAVRVLLGEEIVDVVPERLDLRLAAIEYLQVVHIHNNLDLRHLSDVKLSPFVCVGQQCHAVRMVHEALHAFRSEIRQYRHDDGLVGVHSQIGHAPAGAVAGPKGDVLPLLKTGLVEEDVELLDQSGHL